MRADSVCSARRRDDTALALALFFPLEVRIGAKRESEEEEERNQPLSHQLLPPSIDDDATLFFGWPPLSRLPRSRRAGRTGAAGLRGSVFGWTRTRRACARESAQAGVREGRKEEMNRESGERLFFPSFPLGLSFSFSFSLSLSSSFLTPLLFYLERMNFIDVTDLKKGEQKETFIVFTLAKFHSSSQKTSKASP